MLGASEKTDRKLAVGVLNPVELDPRTSYDFLSNLVLDQVYEPPYLAWDDESVEPLLFAEPLRSPRPTIRTARLREGIRFSDGTPLEARSLIRDLDRITTLTAMGLESIRLGSDPSEIVFELAEPLARFDLVLTQQCCSAVRESSDGLLGTGPFRFAEDSRPDRIRLVPNPERRHGELGLDEIIVQVYPLDENGEPTALLEGLLAGEVHVTNALARRHLRRLRGLRTWFEPGNSTAFLFFNTERPPLDDPAVRRGLAMAIDRTALAEEQFDNALAFRANGPLPPKMGRLADRIHHDPGKAATELRSLADSGRLEKRSLRLVTIFGPRPYLPHPEAIAASLARSLSGIDGVDLEVEVVVTRDSEHYDRLATEGDYDLFLTGWVADTPEPTEYLEALCHGERVPEPGSDAVNRSNLARYRNPRLDRALTELRRRGEQGDRKEIGEILRQDLPFLALFYGAIAGAYSWRLRNFRLSATGTPQFHRMTLR